MLQTPKESALETPHLDQTVSVAGEVFRAAAVAGTEPARAGISALVNKIASTNVGMSILLISAGVYPWMLVKFSHYLMPWGLLPFVVGCLVYGLKRK